MLYGESPDYSVSPELCNAAAICFNANRKSFEQNMENKHRSNCLLCGWELEEMRIIIEQAPR